MTPVDLPREKIPWYPTIDYNTCIGDQECYNFCHNDVFTWDEEKQLPVVANPYNCVIGCTACAQTCPTEAISFPRMEKIREIMKQLRAETREEKPTW